MKLLASANIYNFTILKKKCGDFSFCVLCYHKKKNYAIQYLCLHLGNGPGSSLLELTIIMVEEFNYL